MSPRRVPAPRRYLVGQYRHPGERCTRFGCEAILAIRTEYFADGGRYIVGPVLVCSQGHHWGRPTAADIATWRAS